MILLIDNYDSFSYNLYQLIGEIEQDIKVIRNDEMTIEQILDLKPDGVILSPGPKRPKDAGITLKAAFELGQYMPVLGVCLGHQAICEAFGGVVTYADELMHGKASEITLDLTCDLFKNCPKTTKVARYHSLIAKNLPECLKITALTDKNEVMAVKHNEYPIYGVQFHPESILTPCGKTMLENFIKECKQ